MSATGVTRNQLRRLVHAHDRVWECWWPTLTTLDAAAHRRLRGSWPTLFATADHMVDTEAYWQLCLEADRSPQRRASRTMRGLAREWRRVQQRRSEWLNRVRPHARLQFVADGGVPATVQVWECLIHVVTHAHFHRGQLASQCRQLGVQPPSRHLLGPFFDEF